MCVSSYWLKAAIGPRRLPFYACVALLALLSFVRHAAAQAPSRCKPPPAGKENFLQFDVDLSLPPGGPTSPTAGGLVIYRPIIIEITHPHVFETGIDQTFYVCDPDHLITSLQIDGTPGLPGKVLAPPPQAAPPAPAAPAIAGPPLVPMSVYVFGPRTTATKVTITAAGVAKNYDAAGKEIALPEGTDATTTVVTDIAIDQEYAGAFRLGIAAFFGGADRSYAFVPTGSGGRIARQSSSDISADFVAAYTAFFNRPKKSDPRYWAIGPTIGMGLVSSSAGKVQLVKSLFAGMDFEWNGVSLALLVGLRRSTRLGEQLSVGQFVTASGDIATRDTILPAIGLSLNFSPELFAMAAKGAAAE
jgi:hypothetical protein